MKLRTDIIGPNIGFHISPGFFSGSQTEQFASRSIYNNYKSRCQQEREKKNQLTIACLVGPKHLGAPIPATPLSFSHYI